MPKITTPSTYTCVRDCYYLGRLFTAGEPFPEEWVENGYKVGKHFALTSAAAATMKHAVIAAMSHGDDKRSTMELRDTATKVGLRIPDNWTRKQIWQAVVEREHAAAKTAEPEAKKGSK